MVRVGFAFSACAWNSASGSRAVIPYSPQTASVKTAKGQSAMRLLFGIDSSGDPESKIVADNTPYGGQKLQRKLTYHNFYNLSNAILGEFGPSGTILS